MSVPSSSSTSDTRPPAEPDHQENSPATATATRTRVVVLGASNLTLGFPLVLEVLKANLPAPLDVYAAHGHGRSYGLWSRVLVRDLPGISQCRLWDALDRDEPAADRTFALVTDIGNDLLYGVAPEQIGGWVASCIERLAEMDAHIVLTRLPLASVERLSAMRYHLTRMVFFPGRRIAWDEMRSRARQLNDLLQELGERNPIELVEQPPDWYGFDPIHIRMTRRRRAWLKLFSHWPGFGHEALAPRPTLAARYRALAQTPAERRLFGRTQHGRQPVLQTDEASLWLY